MSNVDKTIGIPSPREYSNNNIVPFNMVPDTDAIIKAEPRKAPTHGVKLIEKIIPNKNAEKNPVIFVAFLLLDLNNFI